MHINVALNSFIGIDYRTDSVIQSSLRHELPADVTVITVAHRLQTIMDADKIVRSSSFYTSPLFILFQMVLDAGTIVRSPDFRISIAYSFGRRNLTALKNY